MIRQKAALPDGVSLTNKEFVFFLGLNATDGWASWVFLGLVPGMQGFGVKPMAFWDMIPAWRWRRLLPLGEHLLNRGAQTWPRTI